MDIQDQSRLLEAAQQRLRHATRELEADKAGRSLLGKLEDALSQTPAEEELAAATEHLSEVEQRLAVLLPRRLEDRVQQEVAAAFTPEATRLRELRAGVLATQSRVAHGEKLTKLAAVAVAELSDAATQCDRASSNELQSVMTNLPQTKAFAEQQGRDATHAINKARAAVDRLGEEMDEIEAVGVEEASRAWWKEVVDIRIPEFSGAAISTLDHAGDRCRTALEQARQLHHALARITQEQHARWREDLAQYQRLEVPFRAGLLETIPALLQEFARRRSITLHAWDGLPDRTGLLDLDAIQRARA